MSEKTIVTWQGLAAFVGITFGGIPLVQFLVTGAAGSIWGWLLDGGGPVGWVGPLIVAALAVILITMLERRRKRVTR